MTGNKAHTRTIRDNELVSANIPFPEIPVTVPQIIRQAGHRTYQRGVAYQRNREVIRYSYDEDERTLTGLVNGSTIIPYEVTIRFFPAVSGSATFTATEPITAEQAEYVEGSLAYNRLHGIELYVDCVNGERFFEGEFAF